MAATSTQVHFRDRRTGGVITEIVENESLLRWFYEDRIGFGFLRLVMNHRVTNRLYGRTKKTSRSRENIEGFVRKHNINIDEIELPLGAFRTFNDFFTRTLKPGSRPFVHDPGVFCSPGDGKVLVHPRLGAEHKLSVKGASVSVAELLTPAIDSATYRNGSAVILRLAPYDYHRFHFPTSGTLETLINVRGDYHSVNPIALAKVPDVFSRNQRSVAELRSDHFGRIAYVEVGALTVGSIVHTSAPGRVEKGQEKGFFQYGGSTIVMLFESGRITFDDDLLRDSADSVEVHVLAGASIGRQPAP